MTRENCKILFNSNFYYKNLMIYMIVTIIQLTRKFVKNINDIKKTNFENCNF